MVVLALWPLVRRRWVQGAARRSTRSAVLFCIMVTANHWILDAVGGWAVLGLGYAGALAIDHGGAALRRWRATGAPRPA